MKNISNNNKPYNICFSLDNNYCEQVSVVIVSILKNSLKDENFNFIIFNDKISEENKKAIESLKRLKDFTVEFIDLDTNEFSHFPIARENNEKYKDCCITRAAYLKYKLASLLKDIDKVLYLDCDLIILDSLKELYNFDITDCYAAMVEDVDSKSMAARFKISNYYNSGVMLVNLKKWREDNLDDKLLDYTNIHKELILWADQDIFNIVMKNKIKPLPQVWNYQFFLQDTHSQNNFWESCVEYKILHYAGNKKPWKCNYNHAIFDKYYEYLSKTPFRLKAIAYKQKKYDFIYDFISKQINERTKKENEYLYKFIEKRIKKENEYLYNFVNEQINERIKKENEYLYNFVNEQINEKIKTGKDYLYNFVNEQINEKIKTENEYLYNFIDEKFKKESEHLYNFVNEQINAKTQKLANTTGQSNIKELGV